VNYDDRLRHTLALAEARFGARVYADAIPPITFHAGPPEVFFAAQSRIAIHLSLRCESDYLLGCYQLAHETIHLLSPVDGRQITTLEEGIAVLFARDYIRDNIDLEFAVPADHRYAGAFALAERFLRPRPDAILRLREEQPIISKISADIIRQVYPEVPLSLCWSLATPFYALSTA
jgi:hypothetical protein